MTADEISENNDAPQQSFASLLDFYSPVAAPDLEVGDRLRGKVVAIGKDTVFVDTGTKIDGVIDRAELLDENRQLTCREGDILELYVVALDENEIRLSRALSGVGGLQLLREAHAKSAPVQGSVIQTCKGGLQVAVMQRQAFCPISQIDLNYVENAADYVGQSLQFLVVRLEENGRNIVLSRRELLERERAESRRQFYATLSVGAVLDGTVTRVMPYGAFVELSSGVEGMVHVSELSWSKATPVDALVSIGDSLRVKVIGIEPGQKAGLRKIALSVKQLTDDPWNTVGERFHEGDKIQGTITRCVNFGAFVELAPGIEGLVHISEMSYQKRILKPEEVVAPGATVAVLIKEIDPEKRRIALSIKDAEGDPWLDVHQNYTVGRTVAGVIEKKEKFGYFIRLAPGITGLLPRSKIGRSANAAAIEKLRDGDTLAVVIEEINLRDRKITLAPGDTADEQDWQRFSRDAGAAMGSLGEKLKQALASRPAGSNGAGPRHGGGNK